MDTGAAVRHAPISTLNYGRDVPDGPPLSAYPLGCIAGREAFLERLVAIGEAGVFEAAAHVWGSLQPPVGLRCTLMGLAAGTGGTAKLALRKVLAAFVREWIGDELPPLPLRQQYATLDEWHRAAMAVWATENQREAAVVQKYSAILNGEAPLPASIPTSATLLKGPWRAKAKRRGPAESARAS